MSNNKGITNVCFRCGKIRITTKTWVEGTITFSESSCPDPKCQALIDKDLNEKREHLKNIQEMSLRRRREKLKRKN